MNLQVLKERVAKLSPFVTVTFQGKDGCLMDGKKPLTVECNPPSTTWIMESGLLTSVILRYSESYQKASKDGEQGLQETIKGQPEVAQEIMKEVASKILKSDEEKLKQIGTIISLSKSYLVSKAVFGHYGNREDKFRLRFALDKYEADAYNEDSGQADICLWVDMIDETELIQVSQIMIEAMPEANEIANIPIKDTEIKSDATLEEGVIGSVPADKVATFPRNTRSIAVEDVS